MLDLDSLASLSEVNWILNDLCKPKNITFPTSNLDPNQKLTFSQVSTKYNYSLPILLKLLNTFQQKEQEGFFMPFEEQ